MSLDPLHEHLARLVFSLPEASEVAIAGGNAMLAHDLVQRPTQDLDLFTPDLDEVDVLARALAEALRAEGFTVEVDRRGMGFSRLAVTTADHRVVAIEIGQDARMRPAVHLSFGRVLDPEEVVADKTLALFGRAAARDLVDVSALEARFGLDTLCRLAAEKDPGFDARVLADAIRAASRHPDQAFAELGLSVEQTERLRGRADQLRSQLLKTSNLALTKRRTTARQYLPSTPPPLRDKTADLPPPRRSSRGGPGVAR